MIYKAVLLFVSVSFCCGQGFDIQQGKMPQDFPLPLPSPGYQQSAKGNYVCNLQPNKHNCGSYTIRYYYDVNEKACLPFAYGGCGEGGNNFYAELYCSYQCLSNRRFLY